MEGVAAQLRTEPPNRHAARKLSCCLFKFNINNILKELLLLQFVHYDKRVSFLC